MVAGLAYWQGSISKKVTVNAMMQVGHGVGALIGPQTALSREVLRYINAKIAIFVSYVGVIALGLILRLLYGWWNRHRIKEWQAELDALSTGCVDLQTLEQTGEEIDMRNKAFVYLY